MRLHDSPRGSSEGKSSEAQVIEFKAVACLLAPLMPFYRCTFWEYLNAEHPFAASTVQGHRMRCPNQCEEMLFDLVAPLNFECKVAE